MLIYLLTFVFSSVESCLDNAGQSQIAPSTANMVAKITAMRTAILSGHQFLSLLNLAVVLWLDAARHPPMFRAPVA
jgi:hypothetical protein